MTKTKPCTLGPKHKWAWKRNTSLSNMTIGPMGSTVRVSLRGLYLCECGERRLGQPSNAGADLVGLGI